MRKATNKAEEEKNLEIHINNVSHQKMSVKHLGIFLDVSLN